MKTALNPTVVGSAGSHSTFQSMAQACISDPMITKTKKQSILAAYNEYLNVMRTADYGPVIMSARHVAAEKIARVWGL